MPKIPRNGQINNIDLKNYAVDSSDRVGLVNHALTAWKSGLDDRESGPSPPSDGFDPFFGSVSSSMPKRETARPPSSVPKPADALLVARRLEGDPSLKQPGGVWAGSGPLLSLLGSRLCHASNPDCGACPVSFACRHARRAERDSIRSRQGPTFIDLFAGCGGMSLGFRSAGFIPAAAVDIDDKACESLRLNFPELEEGRVITGDIRNLDPRDVEKAAGHVPPVMIGSPPCQGFSHAGKRARSFGSGYDPLVDPRNILFRDMLELCGHFKPALFLLENVPGMDSVGGEAGSYLDTASRNLVSTGFKTKVWKLNAADFGVPQNRIRCFLVGWRTPLEPRKPVGEHGLTDAVARWSLPPVTLGEALLGLPSLEAGDGALFTVSGDPAAVDHSGSKRYLLKHGITGRRGVVAHHFTRAHNPRDRKLFAMMRPGENSIAFLERTGRSDLIVYRKDVFDDKYLRLRADRPCRTIVSHLKNDGNSFIHPFDARALTVREAARVMSFPDSFLFCGAVSDQWSQVGNAVPPLMSRAIAESFLEVLKI